MQHALAVQRDGVLGVFEIVGRVQIGNQPRLNRSQSQPLLGQGAGSGNVHTKEETDPAKMIGCFVARLADHRYVQMPADPITALSSGSALVCHAVISGCSGAFLKREPVEMSRIESMHRGPAVEPVAYKCGNALFPGDADQAWYKAVITGAVDRWGKPQHR